ncbi:hypothetical protein Tco_0605517 [Tanacetum coccineum]
MQDILPGVFFTVLTLLGPTVVNSSSFPIKCQMTVNSLVFQSSSDLLMLKWAEIVTSPPSMPLKALSYNIFKNSSPISSLELVIVGELVCSSSRPIVLSKLSIIQSRSWRSPLS